MSRIHLPEHNSAYGQWGARELEGIQAFKPSFLISVALGSPQGDKKAPSCPFTGEKLNQKEVWLTPGELTPMPANALVLITGCY